MNEIENILKYLQKDEINNVISKNIDNYEIQKVIELLKNFNVEEIEIYKLYYGINVEKN